MPITYPIGIVVEVGDGYVKCRLPQTICAMGYEHINVEVGVNEVSKVKMSVRNEITVTNLNDIEKVS